MSKSYLGLIPDKFLSLISIVRRSVTLVIVLGCGLCLAACGSGLATAKSSSVTSSTTTSIPQENLVNVAIPAVPGNFNPHTPAGNSLVTREIMSQVWPSAFYENSKFQFVLNSMFLDSAELVSTSPETIVYHINKDATWSDGIPITASDFIYNWRAQSGSSAHLDVTGLPFLSNSSVGYSDIKSITGSNNGRTVKVVFKRHFSEWERLFRDIVPAHVGETAGWNSGFTSPFSSIEVSGGPYAISQSSSTAVVLDRNSAYWGKRPKIAKISFNVDSVPTRFASQFQAGSLDIALTPAHDLLYSSISSVVGVKTTLVPSSTVNELIMNMRSGPLSAIKVRQAIALGIDRATIAYDSIGSYMTDASPAGNNIYAPGVPQYRNDGSLFENPNPTKAISLLTSDGYVLSSSGVMMKNSKPLTLSIVVDQSDQQELLVEQLIIQELKSIGIIVVPKNTNDGDLYGSVLPKANFNLSIISVPGGANAAFDVVRFDSSSANNYSGLKSTSVDKMIIQASEQLDPGTSTSIYNSLDQVIWKDLPTIPLYSVPDILAYRKGYNFVGSSSPGSTIFWNANNWSYTVPSQ